MDSLICWMENFAGLVGFEVRKEMAWSLRLLKQHLILLHFGVQLLRFPMRNPATQRGLFFFLTNIHDFRCGLHPGI